MNQYFSLILAVDDKNGLGKNGDLAWNIPEDMKYFKKITTDTQDPKKQNVVIMGRKTWDSIPKKYRPLPSRINIVLSSRYTNIPENIEKNSYGIKSLEDAFTYISQLNNRENIFIIGGSMLYNSVLNSPYLEKIYLTKVQGDFGCDVFFDGIPREFIIESSGEKLGSNGLHYRFLIYKKKMGYIKTFLQKIFSK